MTAATNPANPHAPPPPVGPEAERMSHSRLRRRILYGEWERDLLRRIEAQIGAVRREAWGKPDLSANVLRSISAQHATLYDQPVTVTNPIANKATADAAFAALLDEASLWPLMQRVQRDTIGLREMIVRVDVSDKGALRFRVAYPDLVTLEKHPDDPMRPAVFRELRPRYIGGRLHWLWDVLELRDDGTGSYRVFGSKQGQPDMQADLSDKVLGGAKVGDSYPYRYGAGEAQAGEPFLPIGLYHAQTTGQLWDPFEWLEVVEATLQVGVYWSFWGHVVKDASWPQRYAAGVTIKGASVEGDHEHTRRNAITTDPSTVVMLRGDPDAPGTAQVGQWSPGGDPDKLAEAIAAYERRVIAYVGMAPSDIHRQSGDPRSGYALAITRDAQRQAQRRLTPTFERTDRDLLHKAAALWNRWAEGDGELPLLPESGWRPRYQPIPLSPEERRAALDEVKALLDLGFIDRAEALRRVEGSGMTKLEAERELKRLERVAAKEAANKPKPPPPPPPKGDDENDDDENDDPENRENPDQEGEDG